VDLTGNEVYEILRKRLFKKLPEKPVIHEIATAYGKVLAEASKAKHISRSAESIADEIVGTYPFHPRLKNLVALFKENEKFKQTRGLMELISRLLKSVWSRGDNDVYLIGRSTSIYRSRRCATSSWRSRRCRTSWPKTSGMRVGLHMPRSLITPWEMMPHGR